MPFPFLSPFRYSPSNSKFPLLKYSLTFPLPLFKIYIITVKKYEGEFLNGKRNGKGKEYYYYNGKLKFEGDYLNGEKNGKVKEYYDNGKLKYEGEYLNGKRNGKGKEYDDDGNLVFEGCYMLFI